MNVPLSFSSGLLYDAWIDDYSVKGDLRFISLYVRQCLLGGGSGRLVYDFLTVGGIQTKGANLFLEATQCRTNV